MHTEMKLQGHAYTWKGDTKAQRVHRFESQAQAQSLSISLINKAWYRSIDDEILGISPRRSPRSGKQQRSCSASRRSPWTGGSESHRSLPQPPSLPNHTFINHRHLLIYMKDRYFYATPSTYSLFISQKKYQTFEECIGDLSKNGFNHEYGFEKDFNSNSG